MKIPFSELFSQRPSWPRLLAPVTFIAVHLIIFLAFQPMFGRGIAAFALVPAVTTGWLFGWQSGLIAGTVLTFLNGSLIIFLLGPHALDGIFAIGSLFVVASGTAVGWLQQQLTRFQKEVNRANEMAAAANALRDGIATVNSTPDLQEVLNKILLYLGDVVPHDAANIMLIEDDISRVYHHRGYPEAEIENITSVQLHLSQTPNLQQMIQTRQPIIIPDTQTYSSWIKRNEDSSTRAYMGAPINTRDRVIGFLNVSSATPNFFNQNHAIDLQAFADQAAIAIENAHLFKQAQKEEERFRLIFELAPTGIAIVSTDGRFQRVNQAFCKTIGYTAAELLNMTFIDITPPDDINTHLAMDKRLLKGEMSQYAIEKRYVHKEGHLIHAILQVALIQDDKGAPQNLIGQIIDITQRKVAEEQLRHNAFHDTLTTLPNRTLFLDHVQRAIGHAERQNHYAFAVFVLDLDRFKVINDSLGHAAGDELLKVIGQRLAANIRPGDTVARFGGDEFAILLDGMQKTDEVQLIAEQIQHSLSIPLRIAEHDNDISLTASIGIILSSSRRQRAEEYVRDADTAMYRAKEQGGNRIVVFNDEMHTVALARLHLETDLRQAMKVEGLQIYYQPILSLPDGHMSKVECLLRWPHIQQGFISPTQFIPMAEETGLINPIGEWLMWTACKQAKKWHDLGYPIRMAINVSLRQLQYQDLPQLVQEILNETGLPATSLELEITESIAMASRDFSAAPLQKLAAMGVHISIDDFGTGYSSLNRLKTLPISALKIDRSFITELTEDTNDRAMVQAIIAMAHSLKLKVVAEGVETMDQLTFLRQQKCDQIQGYLVSPPLSSSDLLAFVEEKMHIGETEKGTTRALFIS